MIKKHIHYSILVLALLFCATSALFAQEQESEDLSERNSQLMSMITKLTERHNLNRKNEEETFKTYGYDSKQMIDLEALIYEDDLKNIAVAKKIFNKYGFPTISLVGKEKSHEFGIIVQSCDMDIDFQLAVLKVTDKLIHDGEADIHDYAFLSDKVRLTMGMKQIYGTQVKFNNSKNVYEPHNLNNPAEVDKRRAELNLERLSVYIKDVNKNYRGTFKRKTKSRRSIKKL